MTEQNRFTKNTGTSPKQERRHAGCVFEVDA